MSEHDLVIGFLEDDPDQSDLVLHWLEQAGYRTRLFNSAAEFRRRQGSEAIDLLLLDWMLPDSSGPEVVEWIRASANSRLPVIFPTAMGTEADMVRGLNAGGDDYVVKPAKRLELIARVGAVLRRLGLEGNDASQFDLPPYSVDAARRRIPYAGKDVELR